MSDARRRGLERGGDAESEARTLVEAVRAGELTRADLDLAADLGDARAGLATGRAAAPLAALSADLAAGPRRLAAACALGELAFPAWCWPLRVEPLVGEWVGEGVEALRAARDRGTPVERERVWNAHEAASQRDSYVVELGALAARVVGLACEAAASQPASLARAARLAAGILSVADVRTALARALLAPRLRPPAPATPPGWAPEAEQLRARLRDGRCDRARLELAHALGHEAASAALDLAPPSDLARATRLTACVAGLDPEAPLTREVVVRTLLATFSIGARADPATPAGKTTHALAAWCLAPDEGRAAEASRASQVIPSTGEEAPGLFGPTRLPVELLRLAARACGAPPPELRDLLQAGQALEAPHVFAWGLRRHVVPWLLGYRDVLLELDERD